jgi:hypothetical protein
MTESEQNEFEKRLRRTRPAELPDGLAVRLRATVPERAVMAPSWADYFRAHWDSLRWFIPATAVALAAMLAWQGSLPVHRQQVSAATSNPAWPVLQADEVKIDQKLLSSFDAVARLPGGEPVRFRCESWLDEFVLSDKSRGVVVENRQPRFEVVPVGYETY